jgi:hypothetical protein
VTNAVLIPSAGATPTTRAIFFARPPVRLRGAEPLALEVTHLYRVEDPTSTGDWTTRTIGYRYQLYLPNETELLAFHWHPEDPNPVKFPHLHLSAGAQLGFPALARAHIPTGPVSLQAVLRFAIEDLGVRPLRADWPEILSERRLP